MAIKKRSKDSWTLILPLPRDPLTGKRRQRWLTVRGSRRDAEREYRKLLGKIEEGADLRPERITVAGFIDQWLRDSVAMRVRPSTLTSYQELQNSLRPTLGWLLLAKLRESQVQASYRALLDQGLAPATVLHTHRMLRQALSQAVKWRLIAHNPTDGVDPPRPGRYEAKILDVEDSWRVLEAADETQIGSLVPPTALYRAPSR